MMAVSAHDIAAVLRARLREPGVVKVHKLLYYVQGWHLAWTGRPAFSERIEAWTNGPVVADLWRDEKHGSSRSTSQVGDDVLATIDYVLGRYGSLSGVALIRQTHLEDPWRDVSETDDVSSFINPEITHGALQRWFEQDDDRLAYLGEVERLRPSVENTLRAAPVTPAESESITRALGGERVRHSRPA